MKLGTVGVAIDSNDQSEAAALVNYKACGVRGSRTMGMGAVRPHRPRCALQEFSQSHDRFIIPLHIRVGRVFESLVMWFSRGFGRKVGIAKCNYKSAQKA